MTDNNLPVNQLQSEKEENYIAIDPKCRTFFFRYEKLLMEENEMIEYKNYNMPRALEQPELVDILKKQICGFLNNRGGRLYIGVTDSKVVHGCKLSDKERDRLRNDLTNLTTDFYPKCRSEKIKVHFLPVKFQGNCGGNFFIPNLFVVKIIVKQGQVEKLYSTSFKGYRSFIRLEGQCVELQAMEIEGYIVQRNKNPREEIPEKEFQDPEPERFIPPNIQFNLNPRSRGSSPNPYVLDQEETNSESFKGVNTESSMKIISITGNNIYNNKQKFETINEISESNERNVIESKEKLRRLNEKENMEKKFFSAREKNVGKSLGFKVSISNLGKNVTKDDLAKLLSPYLLDHNDPILFYKIGDHPFSYVTVCFADKHEAIKARDNLNGFIFKGNKINLNFL
jgi:hypothetical protein